MRASRGRQAAGGQIGPFLKWAGGKGQLLPQLARLFPQIEGREYVEPFMGSGAVFFHVVQNYSPTRCTLLDINPELVNTFRRVRDDVNELIQVLREHEEHHNRADITQDERKEYYYGVRSREPEPCSVESAARFIYLNKTCFNGLHRLNSKGKFNVPMGDYKNPNILDDSNLRRTSVLLRDTRIEVCSYNDCEKFICDGAFAYFDPPYEPLSRTSSFTSYSKEDFTQHDQKSLRDLLRRLIGRCDWMMSNSTADLILQLYNAPDFHQNRVMASRSINSIGEGRGKIQELVVTSYETTTISSHDQQALLFK